MKNILPKSLILLFFFHSAYAQRKEPHKSVQISPGYFSGEYLIYDCKKKNFACVDDESFTSCRESREHAITVLENNLPCAPLKKFPHFDDCEVAQYKEIERPKKTEFCFLKKSKIH